MKKILKIVGIALVCLIVLGNMVKIATRPIYERSLSVQAARANQECPIPLPYGNGTVTAIKLKNEYLEYHYSLDSQFSTLLGSIDPDKAKETFVMGLLCIDGQGESKGATLLDKLVEEGCGLKIVINDSARDGAEYSVTAQDIQSMRRRFELDPHEALHSLLWIGMEAERMNLPFVLGDGMALTDCRLEGVNIVFTIDLAEDVYSIDQLKANASAAKNSFISGMKDEAEIKALFYLCKVSHTGIVYRYVGNTSHKRCDITFSYDEL